MVGASGQQILGPWLPQHLLHGKPPCLCVSLAQEAPGGPIPPAMALGRGFTRQLCLAGLMGLGPR